MRTLGVHFDAFDRASFLFLNEVGKPDAYTCLRSSETLEPAGTGGGGEKGFNFESNFRKFGRYFLAVHLFVMPKRRLSSAVSLTNITFIDR